MGFTKVSRPNLALYTNQSRQTPIDDITNVFATQKTPSWQLALTQAYKMLPKGLSYNHLMKHRSLLILIFICVGVSGVEYSTGEVTFSTFMDATTVDIIKMDNPIIVLTISDIDYKAPFSLALDHRRLVGPDRDKLEIQLVTNNSTRLLSSVTISVRYLVSLSLSGFELFTFNVSSSNNRMTIIPKSANSVSLKRGYYITGFSDSQLLASISVNDYPGNIFEVLLSNSSFADWVILNFVVLDLSAVSGCTTHNLFNGTVRSYLNGMIARARFSLTNSDQTQTMIGLSDMRSSSGMFQWTDVGNQSFAIGTGQFNFVILQLDTSCVVADSEIGRVILPQPVNLQAPLISPTTQQTQAISPPASNDLFFFPTVPISPYLPTQRTEQQLLNLPLPVIQVPATLTPVVNQGVLPPNLIVLPTPQPIVQTLQPTSDSQLRGKPILLDPPKWLQPIHTTVNPWKILGFVLLSWLGISILAIPLLCCLLYRSRKRQQHQNEVVRRYDYGNGNHQPQQIMDRGTDIRLRVAVNEPPVIQLREVHHSSFVVVSEPIPFLAEAKNVEAVGGQTEAQENMVADIVLIQPLLSPNDKQNISYDLRHPGASDLFYSQSVVKSLDPSMVEAANELPDIGLSPQEPSVPISITQMQHGQAIAAAFEKFNQERGIQESQDSEVVGANDNESPPSSLIGRQESSDNQEQPPMLQGAPTLSQEMNFQQNNSKHVSENDSQDDVEGTDNGGLQKGSLDQQLQAHFQNNSLE